jgi:hypothetical protein
MEFKLLLEQLNNLNLPKDKYVVVGSGSMAAHGIREANDFDILVTFDLWEEFEKDNPVVMSGKTQNILFGDLQILGNGSMYRIPEIASIEEMISTADIIEGHPFLKLELVKKFKKNEGREKDLKDIDLIDEYLKEETNFNG